MEKLMGMCDSVAECATYTPLVHAHRICKNPNVRLLLKVEFVNPSGSIKDRIVKDLLDEMDRAGRLPEGTTVVCASSGNTAAALAMMCATRQLQAICVLPPLCSSEKVSIIRAFGAHTVIADAEEGTCIQDVARRIQRNTPNSVLFDQYNSASNVDTHSISTGPEIWCQSGGDVDMFICGASTGGTISGIARYLKQKNANLTTVLADTSDSVLFGRVQATQETSLELATEIEGMGVRATEPMPACLLFEHIDSAIKVSDYDAIAAAHQLARVEGILAGMSGGANVAAALKLAETITRPTTVVTVIPDGGFKYLSKLYNEDWLARHHLPVPSSSSSSDAESSGAPSPEIEARMSSAT